MRKPKKERRNTGERRWGLAAEYPVRDCNGIQVISDRRNMPDRRLDNTTLEERQWMFAGMPTTEIE
jgi:hypothetical protein